VTTHNKGTPGSSTVYGDTVDFEIPYEGPMTRYHGWRKAYVLVRVEYDTKGIGTEKRMYAEPIATASADEVLEVISRALLIWSIPTVFRVDSPGIQLTNLKITVWK